MNTIKNKSLHINKRTVIYLYEIKRTIFPRLSKEYLIILETLYSKVEP